MDAIGIEQIKNKERPPEVLSFTIRRDEFCRKLGGGLPRGSITLLEGEDGTGKSLISQRILYGLLENGFTVTYISTDLSTKDFIQQMQSLNYDIVKYLLNKQLLFIPVFPITKKLRSKPKNLIERMMSAPHLFENQVIIIDCLTVMLENGKMDGETKFKFSNFLKKLTGIDKTLLITLIPGSTAEDVHQFLTSLCDNILVLKSKILGTDLKNYITVIKWKRTKGEVNKIIGFKVEPNIGFVLDISSFAG
ncbi:ATPase [Candidatus Micrarchaeota archaeon]|nr:MAG: ATPase [Candidatus Micrarchaeota archaeon]